MSMTLGMYARAHIRNFVLRTNFQEKKTFVYEAKQSISYFVDFSIFLIHVPIYSSPKKRIKKTLHNGIHVAYIIQNIYIKKTFVSFSGRCVKCVNMSQSQRIRWIVNYIEKDAKSV